MKHFMDDDAHQFRRVSQQLPIQQNPTVANERRGVNFFAAFAARTSPERDFHGFGGLTPGGSPGIGTAAFGLGLK